MFSVAGNGGDTQVLDANPSLSDCETDDRCGDGGEDEEIPILYGETQALDDADDAAVGGRDGVMKGCCETQLVETCADEASERTEVLREEEETSSCAETSCDAVSGGGGDAQGRADGDDLLDEALEKEDDSANSDISTDNDDDEEDVGSRKRRSFADIRAKAVRSSGLAASRHVASKKFNSGLHSKKDENSEAGRTDVRIFGVNDWADNKKYPTSLYSEIGELHLEFGKENSIGSSEDHYNLGDKDNKSSNKRVRKLFDDTHLEKNESESKFDDTAEQKIMPHLLSTDNIAGLSYVTSQEPGHQSQVNALELVDKFLLTNDVGSSQELKSGKSDIYKCAPASSKLLGCLAEKNVRRNSLGIPSTFDWDDNLEDEGGGDFFWKRKDSLLEGTSAAQKSKSHPPKTRPSITGRSVTLFENSQVIKGGTRNNCIKLAASAHSDSRLVMLKSMKNDMHHISQTKAKKSLFMGTGEESTSKALEHNIVMADAEVVYNIGPDTQMAAEAMEALCHVSAVNSDEDKHLTPGASMQKNNGSVKKSGPSENALHQKRRSIADPSDAEGIITRSKRTRIHASEERKESSSLHRDLSITRTKSHGNKNSKVKTRMERLKLHDQSTVEISGRHATSESSTKKKGQKRMVKNSCERVDIFLDQQNDHSSLSKGLKIGAHDDDSAPVAHRTRHSKRLKLLEDTESLSKESVDASAPQGTRTGCSNVPPQLDLGARRHSSSYSRIPNSGTALEESKGSFLEETWVNHPKCKRTTRQTSSNQNYQDDVNQPNVLLSNIEKMDKQAKHGEINKVYIRSVSEILVKTKQKKIVSTQMLLENVALFSDFKLAQTRSLQKSPLVKSNSDTGKCLYVSVSNQVSPVVPATLCSNGLNDHVVEPQELSSHKSGEEDTENAEKNAKQKFQSPNLAYETPSKGKNALSPVCVAEDLPRSFKKASATPVARELLRLEASAASAAHLPTDVRRRKDMASVRVLFSNHLDEDTVKQQKKILTRLGLAVASSILEATHFVTDKFVRTQNMLEAIAVGKPVVTPMWLESCGQASCFLDERNYILRDTKKEKELGFNMQVSLARACQCPILLGKTVYMTPNVKPSRKVLSSIVKAANGQEIARIGRSMMKQAGVPADLLIISCIEDYSLCIPLLEKGAQIFSSELLLNGIVIQKLEYGRHQLFLDHVRRTRSTLWLRNKDGDQFLPVNRRT